MNMQEIAINISAMNQTHRVSIVLIKLANWEIRECLKVDRALSSLLNHARFDDSTCVVFEPSLFLVENISSV